MKKIASKCIERNLHKQLVKLVRSVMYTDFPKKESSLNEFIRKGLKDKEIFQALLEIE